MLQMVRRIFPLIIYILLSGCNHFEIRGLVMPLSDDVQDRFVQSQQMRPDLKTGNLETRNEYVFYAAADPHINETNRNLGLFNDVMRNDEETAFGIILGDCIEIKDNLPQYLEALAYNPDRHAHNHEIFHTLGNHDLYFNGWEDFKESLGPSVYWFEAVFPEGKDLYITLDTAAGTMGGKQTEWFKSFLSQNRFDYRHCVIFTHTNFFYRDNSQTGSGNMSLEESFALIDFLGKQKVSLVLQAHDHYREDLTFKDVRYTVVGTIQDESDAPEYLKVKVNEEALELDWQMIPKK